MLSRKQGYQHVWSQIEKWKPEVSELGGQLLHQLLGLVQLREDGFTLHLLQNLMLV